MHVQKLFAVISVAALVVANSVNAQSADTDAQAKAREAIRQKISEIGGQPDQAAPSNPPVVAPAVATPAPMQQTPAMQPTPAPAPAPAEQAPAAAVDTSSGGQLPYSPRLNPDVEQRVIEAMRAAKAQVDAQQPVTQQPMIQPAPIMTAPAMQSSAPFVTAPTASPMPAPIMMPDAASPKQLRLAELLDLYKADKITPAEYHQERAKIVAAP